MDLKDCKYCGVVINIETFVLETVSKDEDIYSSSFKWSIATIYEKYAEKFIFCPVCKKLQTIWGSD